jgi:hypothetical protein
MVFGGEIEVDESYFGGKRESPGIRPFEAPGEGLHEDHSRCLISDAIPRHGAETRACQHCLFRLLVGLQCAGCIGIQALLHQPLQTLCRRAGSY